MFKEINKIKVLHIFAGVGVGGGEQYLLLLADKLDKNRYEVLFVSTKQEKFLEEARRRDLEVLTVDMDSHLNPLTFLKIRSFIFKKKISIVHTHGAGASLYGRVAAKWAKVPVILTTVHNSLYDYPINKLKKCIYIFVDKLTAHFCDKIICVSNAIASDLISRTKIKPEKILTVHNGIDYENFKNVGDNSYLFREFNIDLEDRKIGIIGRLTHQKGHIYFLKAVSELIKEFPDIKCFIVGDGDLKDELIKTAKTWGILPNCIFTGNRRDVTQILSILDVFVLSSVSEGFPIVLLEAMAAGCPVVSSNVGGVPELIEDGINGVLVPSQNHESLVRAISDLLKSKNKRQDMGAAARRIVEEKFNAGKMVNKVQEIYDNLIKEKIL